MGYVVEAWFHDSVTEAVFELLCSALTIAGFTGVNSLTIQTVSWDCVTLEQHKVFVAISSRTENHLVATIKAELDWSEGYSSFEKIFIYLLYLSKNVQIAEFLLSIRNPEPYPFLTHSFHRGLSPLTIIDLDKNQTTQTGEGMYWTKLGPELHFIADEVFKRVSVDKGGLSHRLDADIIELEGGVLLDCGWTNEFTLPEQISSI